MQIFPNALSSADALIASAVPRLLWELLLKAFNRDQLKLGEWRWQAARMCLKSDVFKRLGYHRAERAEFGV